MAESTCFAQLRNILSQEPSWRAWNDLLELFEDWEEEEEQELALDYAQQHLESWPLHCRQFQEYLPEHPCWPLARCFMAMTARIKDLNKWLKDSPIEVLHIEEEMDWENHAFVRLPQLKQLFIDDCYSLIRLNCLANLQSLTHLEIVGPEIENLDALTHMKQLEHLDLQIHVCLDLEVLSRLRKLRSLSIYITDEFTTIASLEALSELTELEELYLHDFSALTDLSALAQLTQLKKLHLVGCYDLTDISPLSQLTQLEELNLSHAYPIEDAAPLIPLKNLEKLIIHNCSSLSRYEFHFETAEEVAEFLKKWM